MIFRETIENDADVIHEIVLQNGLIVRFLNRTQRYFGDYHHVRLEVACDVTATEGEPAGPSGLPSCRYTCGIGRMGVPSADVPAVIEELISSFSATTLAYMSSPSFPLRYVRAQMARQPSHGNLKFTPGF